MNTANILARSFVDSLRGTYAEQFLCISKQVIIFIVQNIGNQ